MTAEITQLPYLSNRQSQSAIGNRQSAIDNGNPCHLSHVTVFSYPIMTVKSDRWIRRMAEQHQLISPFEPKLVRHVDGRRIISAGASSYGYDMRLADDGFRIFSPIHGREIDPKAFDDESLVEPPLRYCGRWVEVLPAFTTFLCARGNR